MSTLRGTEVLLDAKNFVSLCTFFSLACPFWTRLALVTKSNRIHHSPCCIGTPAVKLSLSSCCIESWRRWAPTSASAPGSAPPPAFIGMDYSLQSPFSPKPTEDLAWFGGRDTAQTRLEWTYFHLECLVLYFLFVVAPGFWPGSVVDWKMICSL